MNGEIKKLIQTYRIYKMCPICKEGYMNCDSPMAAMLHLFDNKGIDHTCSKCGHKESYEVMYPREEVKEIEVE